MTNILMEGRYQMIYVDRLVDYGPKGKWCHMATDSDDPEELHRFARKIGLKQEWFQRHPRIPHYDLSPGKRSLAVQEGAIEVSNPELFRHCDIMRDKSHDRQRERKANEDRNSE